MTRIKSLSLALCALFGSACASEDGATLGRASFALDSDAPFFRLRIFESPPDAALSQKSLFDTGCIAQQSRTYELSNIPIGSGYTVVYEGFPTASCIASERLALGYRGEVSIAEKETPYFHVQVYAEGGVSTLPEGINISAAAASPIAACSVDSDCPNALDICFDDAAPTFWCVPSCAADADCVGLHPRATCEVETGWCMLANPYPLNLSEPRAFGRAATRQNGDVVFFGGLRSDPGGSSNLVATVHALEAFDASTGLFKPVDAAGEAPSMGGAFGFAELGGDRFVAVGGLRRASLTSDSQGRVNLDANWAQDLSDDLLVWDLAAGSVSSSKLPRGIARSVVVPLAADRFLVIGGLVSSGPGVEATRSTLSCRLDGGVACVDGPLLQHARQSPAATCLDAACAKVLIIGGNQGGKIAEVLDIETGKSDAFAAPGFGEALFEPVLCGLDLIAGSAALDRSVPVPAVRFTVTPTGIEANPLAGAPVTAMYPAVAGLKPILDGTGCTVAGGVLETSVTTSIIATGGGEFAPYQATLGAPRFGGQAARIGGGALSGRVIIAGGLTLPTSNGQPASGVIEVVPGAEVLSPRGAN